MTICRQLYDFKIEADNFKNLRNKFENILQIKTYAYVNDLAVIWLE